MKLNWMFLVGLLLGGSWIGCARMGTLNLQEHHYGTFPTRIVWIQVAGLQDEHLAILRFFRPTTREMTSFEKMSCLGKIWTYNLYQVRPLPFAGLFAQITGRSNIKNTCEDFALTPLWSYMIENGYLAGVFESTYSEELSLDKAFQCVEGKDFLKGLYLWEAGPHFMGPFEDKRKEEALSKDETQEKKNPKKLFHIQDSNVFRPGTVYYDRSCQKGICYSGLFRNVEYLFENFHKNRNQYFFMVRDFTFFKSLKDRDMEKSKEILLEIEKIYRYFSGYLQNDPNMLLLLSSTAPLNVEFPDEGKDWSKFEEKGQAVTYKKTSLLAPVFAKGARAENFCGIYEEAEIFQRLIIENPKMGP